jgi:AmmeMemoRadiSam system protein B
MIRPMMYGSRYGGWYSSLHDVCKSNIESFIDTSLKFEGKNPISCVVPHAGWTFCGKWAINCIRLLKENNPDIKNVFIFGGHMSVKSNPLLETFDSAQTPFGLIPNNKDVIEFLKKEKNIDMTESIQDNTIELLLPIVKYYFPESKVTAIYMPPNGKTIGVSQRLFDNFHEGSVFIGSTDLTHYGIRFGLIHEDKSIKAVDWVKNFNDKQFIQLLLEMKGEEAISHAIKNKSACSSGAALASLTVAKQAGRKKGYLIGQSTSADIDHNDRSEDFVGYTGIIW